MADSLAWGVVPNARLADGILTHSTVVRDHWRCVVGGHWRCVVGVWIMVIAGNGIVLIARDVNTTLVTNPILEFGLLTVTPAVADLKVAA